jgi:adenine-specific DNA-methyltransferase
MQDDTKVEKSAGGGLAAAIFNNEDVRPNTEFLAALRAALPQYFDAAGSFKSDKFAADLQANNSAESRDGYKLGFVGKDYARLQVGRASETMIVPDCKHNNEAENQNSGNVFITGDNLEALRHLQNAYAGKVKMIYIDPPYNTGKEFVYNDKFEFQDEKLTTVLGYGYEEIERLKSIQGKSSHSAWLTFMYPRLKIAQKLLADDGVIFVSIDDNEQANLKLLMDDVFGEGNFVCQFIREAIKGGSQSEFIRETHDYILSYAKKINELEFIGFEKEELSLNLSDEKGMYARGRELNKWGAGSRREDSPSMWYSIKGPDDVDVYPIRNDGSEGRWRLGKQKMQYLVENDGIIFEKREDGTYIAYEKLRGNKSKYTQFISILKDKYINAKGTETLKALFETERVVFDFSKPVELIKDLLVLTNTNGNDIILDFFAGSATTAQAVTQLNAEDGGNRKFIMVQIDEPTNPESEARKAGYNTIDEIARERIKRAAKKIKAEEGMFEARQDLGFKHYRLAAPDVQTIDKIIEFNPNDEKLLKDDMIAPFANKDTGTSGLETLLTTWLIDGGNSFDTPVEEVVFAGYKARLLRESQTLYLIDQGFNNDALKAMLNKIGKREMAAGTIVVYSYSFDFAIMRELEIGLNTLDNKPHLIKRY